jgi:APA family basic amino acid/polyamine antiporter
VRRRPLGEAGESFARAAGERRESLTHAVEAAIERGRKAPGPGIVRGLGVPALFAIGSSAVGSALYLILGIVAGEALGLTPVVFLVAAAFFVLTMLTYVEGNSTRGERGGVTTFARYAFDEFWSFVAGWAILLDYLIVMALGAFAISHYLAPFWSQTTDVGLELGIAALALAYVVWANVRGLTVERLGLMVRLGLVNGALLAVIAAVGIAVNYEIGDVLGTVDLGAAPAWGDLVFGAVIATVAMTGIEAAAGLANDLRVPVAALRRVVVAGTVAVVVLYVGVSLAALSAHPVLGGATALGGPYLEAPVLGIVAGVEPAWLMDALRYAVAVVAAIVLVQAVNGQMLGVSRLGYSLATNRQIPLSLGRLHPERSTPYIVIAAAGVIAFGLAASRDVEFLAGLFAFGAMLAFLIAHVAIIVLRFREPDVERGFAIPFSIRVGRGSLPLPAVLGAVVSLAAWVSVIVLHEGARVAGLAWMAAGVVLFVLYRRSQDESLTDRFTITPSALQEAPEIEYGSILVPIFGGPLDDDIVGTAGRLAAEESEDEAGAVIEALYVVEIPMALPIDARVPDEKLARARSALSRAKEVGEEYEGVEVATATARARSVGQGIVDEARRRGVEAIVLAAEGPTSMRGGGKLGGRGRPKGRAVGDTTRYVVEKAPCRVILTAAPEEDGGDRTGVRP